VLDMTHGNGTFWRGESDVLVTGLDIVPARARDVAADFTRLPFVDDAFDVCVFDPPYLADTAKAGTSLVGRRFGSYVTQRHVWEAVDAGVREAWRVSRIGVLVKVANHTHGLVAVRMTDGGVRLMDPRLAATVTEKQWAAVVEGHARRNGWHYRHDTATNAPRRCRCGAYSQVRRNEAGALDYYMTRGNELIWVELKTTTGRLSVEQELEIERLLAAGQRVYVWRPSQRADVERMLGP
jgi:hypothetical protein